MYAYLACVTACYDLLPQVLVTTEASEPCCWEILTQKIGAAIHTRSEAEEGERRL